MQSQESNTGTAGNVKHPDASEWMDYLYREVASERRRELEAHLAECADCTKLVADWRDSMATLNQWKLPRMRRRLNRWLPAFKWAAAAAVVLIFGFALGRQTSSNARDVAGLKASVAQLSDLVQRQNAAAISNSVVLATRAASTEVARVLSDYAELQDAQRTSDQQAVAAALNNFDTRLAALRTELETVAVNTATGFEQTHDNLTRLASLSASANQETSTNPN